MTPFSSQQPCRVALLTMTGTPLFVRRVNTQLVHSSHQTGGTCPLALAAERILPREVLVPKASRTIAEGNQFSSNVTETYVRKPTGGAEHCRHARLRC